jgi:hypothetical protein
VSLLDLIGPNRPIDPAVIQASAARGDAVYPYAEYRPIPEAATQPHRSETTTFVLHTMAGPDSTTPDQLWRYVARDDIRGESTWILGYSQLLQVVPVTVRADNNYKANPFATSVETQDEGYEADPGIAKTPWNDYQLAQLAGLSAWQVIHPRLDIPLRRADHGWNGGGIDGHRRYSEWSNVTGKTCPGQARWNQIPAVLAAAQFIVDWRPADPPPISALEVPPGMWLVAKTDQGFLASPGLRQGAYKAPEQVPYTFPWYDAESHGGPRAAYDLATKLPVGGWSVMNTVISEAEALRYMGPRVA